MKYRILLALALTAAVFSGCSRETAAGETQETVVLQPEQIKIEEALTDAVRMEAAEEGDILVIDGIDDILTYTLPEDDGGAALIRRPCPQDNHVLWLTSCEEPAVCSVCGATRELNAEHNWVEADCARAKHCTICYQSEGEPLGHRLKQASIYESETAQILRTVTLNGETVHVELQKDGIPIIVQAGKCKVCGEEKATNQYASMEELHQKMFLGQWDAYKIKENGKEQGVVGHLYVYADGTAEVDQGDGVRKPFTWKFRLDDGAYLEYAVDFGKGAKLKTALIGYSGNAITVLTNKSETYMVFFAKNRS